jgi:hypothetical protein
VASKKGRKFAELKYLVAIPVPSLDQNGKPLAGARTRKWVQIVEKELTACFGGATPIPSWGTNTIDGRMLYEEGQMLVCAASKDREEFFKYQGRLQRLIVRMGKALNQKYVLVLGFPSDSVLVEMEAGTKIE